MSWTLTLRLAERWSIDAKGARNLHESGLFGPMTDTPPFCLRSWGLIVSFQGLCFFPSISMWRCRDEVPIRANHNQAMHLRVDPAPLQLAIIPSVTFLHDQKVKSSFVAHLMVFDTRIPVSLLLSLPLIVRFTLPTFLSRCNPACAVGRR